DLVNHLPQILADLAAPALARLAIEAEPPELPQAKRVHLRPRLAVRQRWCSGEWIVLRNAVGLARRRMIDVDAQELGMDAAQVLADVGLVRDAAAVAGNDVEHAVGAEAQAAAVVAAVGPGKDYLLAGTIDHRRVAVHREARDA